MAATITDDKDTRPATQPVEGAPAPTASADTDDKDLKAKVEELETRYHDASAKISEMGNVNSELRQKLEEQASTVLSKLTDVVTAQKDSGQTPEDIEAEIASYADQLDNGDSKDIVRLMRDMQRTAIEMGKQEATQLNGATMERIETLQQQLADLSIRSDPAYQQNQTLVDTLVEKANLTTEQAIVVAGLVPKGPENVDALPEPGGMGGGGPIAGAPSEVPKWTQADKDSYIKNMGNPTQEEINEKFPPEGKV